jgi:hypothetical protein
MLKYMFPVLPSWPRLAPNELPQVEVQIPPIQPNIEIFASGESDDVQCKSPCLCLFPSMRCPTRTQMSEEEKKKKIKTHPNQSVYIAVRRRILNAEQIAKMRSKKRARG